MDVQMNKYYPQKSCRSEKKTDAEINILLENTNLVG